MKKNKSYLKPCIFVVSAFTSDILTTISVGGHGFEGEDEGDISNAKAIHSIGGNDLAAPEESKSPGFNYSHPWSLWEDE